ncbi:glyoxylate reductase/hydroxypyruvate reductase-like [Anopheles funestus]|uniref:glyoxylate reductase/hydroxypyruvate reductase-like n=1 Tax=Anopheles funestus TaxID=62324 RepID=UPI0020C6178B|nr:glyoxylate reductase/hydroxypyruvate reductase-like [Anopheles funestus]XP_049280515.1 glyoxylate reductase/hydroxypyruvate reductase-like [Anopheles funestus]XP_049280516.1 glyoxylate reductase/hydroxypyruvate reductase-like [Anopheles funestus]
MGRPRVLVTHHQVQPIALELLRKHYDVIVPTVDFPSRAEILDLCSGVDGLLWTNYKMKLDREVLDACGHQLRAVSVTMNGVDCVDTEELARRNIPLGHTPFIPNNAVADLAIGLMIVANEGLLSSCNGCYSRQPIQGSTVGIVGFGGIGQVIAQRLQGFNIGSILYSGRSPKSSAKKFNAQHVPFEELLVRSDIIFVSCPLNNDTRGLFDRHAFFTMKRTAVLINIARGAIVDERALIDALKSGEIRAAGLDTVTAEPFTPDSELFTLSNCVIVPHLGTATKRTRDEMAVRAVENLIHGLRNETMPSQFE